MKSNADLSNIYGTLLYQTLDKFINRFDGHYHYNDEKETLAVSYYRYNGGEEFTFIVDLKTGEVKE